MIVRRASKHDRVVAGGGAIEMEISKFLRNHSRTIKGKEQMLINAYAKALEVSSLFAKKILIIISDDFFFGDPNRGALSRPNDSS